MRIVTRPDFDGIVCATLLKEKNKITEDILWVEPNEMQLGNIEIRSGDIVANLPYHPACSLWFDHHFTNKVEGPFDGDYRIAPSAAGIVFHYYKRNFSRDFSTLVRETDRIDSADLTMEEVIRPQDFPHILLSMTITNDGKPESESKYWNRLVDLLGRCDVPEIMDDPEIKKRGKIIVQRNMEYREILEKYTTMDGCVSVTDLRPLGSIKTGNRFLVYSLFPDAVVNVKIRYHDEGRKRLSVSIGHSIFNRNCHVNVGLLLKHFEGGGHGGAGSCKFNSEKAENYIPRIIEILKKNEPNEPGLI